MKKVKVLSAYLELSFTTTPTIKSLKLYIDMLAKMGYDEFYLGLTDAYKVEGYPYFNYKRGSYSVEELKELDAYARNKNLLLIPSIQVLGHLGYIYRHNSMAAFMDTPNILEVGNPDAYKFVDKMLETMSKSFVGRRIHIGLDETFGIGTGQYLKHHPAKDKKALLLEYLQEVVKMSKKYNFQLEIWGDGLIDRENTSVSAEDVKNALPKDTIAWQWDYMNYNKKDIKQMILNMKKHAYSLGFAGCAWRFYSYGPGNRYSIKRIKNQLDVCFEQNVERFMVTIWGDRGMPCSIFSILPTLFFAAQYNNGETIDKEKFLNIVGAKYDDVLALDYLNDPHKRKQIEYLSSEAFYLFFTDLLIGNHDMYLAEDSAQKYHSLALKYKRVKCDESLKHMFLFSYEVAKLLSIKGKLGVQIREAYVNKNKEELKQIIDVQLPKLIKQQKHFNEFFNSYYLTEYQPLGIEANQIFLSHMLNRYQFAKERIENYIKNDEPIDEIGNGSLLPDYVPQAAEDRCLCCDYTNLLSYCLAYIG